MGIYSGQYLSYYLKSGPRRYSRSVLLITVVLILAFDLTYIAGLLHASPGSKRPPVQLAVMGPMLLFLVLGAMLASQILDEQVGNALEETRRLKRFLLLFVDGITFLVLIVSLILYTYVAGTGATFVQLPQLGGDHHDVSSTSLDLGGDVEAFISDGGGASYKPGFLDDFGEMILWVASASAILMAPLMILRALRDPLRMILNIPKGLVLLCLSFLGFFVVMSVIGYMISAVYRFVTWVITML